MELELTCPACMKYYSNPVCLPCSHSICMTCAQRLLAPVGACEELTRANADFPDIDKMSLYSEADSGVSMSTGSSRPNSYLASSRADLLSTIPSSDADSCIICPAVTCKKVNYLNELGVASLSHNRVLESIVDNKTSSNESFTAPCQMCQADQNTPAKSMCEQCEVFYCDKCKDEFHPLRGPLANHNLVTPVEGRKLLRKRNREKESKCKHHTDENLTMYCLICKENVCYLCIQDASGHLNHDVQATSSICKSHKVRRLRLFVFRDSIFQ